MTICRIREGRITIVIPKKVLRFATEQHPEFWDGETGEDQPNVKIDDLDSFTKEVERAINDEREDGSTLLTDMLDKAIKSAVEDGCEGIDHDYRPKHDENCSCDRCSQEASHE